MQFFKTIATKVFNLYNKNNNTSNINKMGTNKVVMLRHGESEWNEQNLFCGWYNASLTAKGKEDAAKLSAHALREYKMEFDCAYTSALLRSQQSLDVIMKELKCTELPVTHDWRLNERHYGNLIGYNKRQMADKYGEEQVQIWRRSYDVCPPPITPENPYYKSIRENPNFASIPHDQFPDTESLKCVLERVLPLWEGEILPQVASGKRVLIVAHGTVLRALMKHIENISDKNISSVNIPNSIPCVYDIDVATRKVVGKVQYLAEENLLNKLMEKTASIGK